MKKENLKFLEQLIAAPSPSGFEWPAQNIYKKYIKEYADEVLADSMGNATAVLNPSGKLKVMLSGHIDEIGLIVQYIDDNGFIYVDKIGGVDPSVLPGKRVIVHSEKGPVKGILGRIAIHMLEKEEHGKQLKLSDIWIDIGAKDKKEAQKLISIGDPVTVEYGLEYLNNDRVLSRAFDDKIGVFIVAEVIKALKNKKIDVAVYGTASTQEETGLRGARTKAFKIQPDIGIAIDVTHSMDTPGVNKTKFGEMKLGNGPVLMRGASVNPRVEKMLIKAAEENKIPFQLEAGGCGSGTDAMIMQMTGQGMATGIVSIPLRYMHTPGEVLALSDVENAIKLIVAFIEKLKPEINLIP